MLEFRRTVPLVFLLVAVVASATARAQAATQVTEFIEPFVFFVNPCGDEPVDVTGDSRVTVRQTTSSNGSTHIGIQVLLEDVRGVGLTSGARYRAVGGERDHTSFAEDVIPVNETTTHTIALVSSGSGDNFTAHFTIHFTIDANGVTTSTVVFDRADCHG